MSSFSRARSLHARLLLLLLALLLIPTALPQISALAAAPSGVPDGISIVVSPVTLGRNGVLSPGQSMLIYVVLEPSDRFFSGGVRSFQFGVDVDPRLEVLERIWPTGFGIVNNPTPDDWQVGMLDCIPGDEPFVLATYSVLLPAGAPTTSDLRISLRPLVSGEPLLYGPCILPENLERLVDTGGCTLNPSSPAVLHLSGAPDVLVEGRDLLLAWETWDATTVTLQGQGVAPNGSATEQPLQDTTYTLLATGAGPSASAQFTVDVIREPRIEYFTAVPTVTGGQTKARLAWGVRGSNEVDFSAFGLVHHRSAMLVDIPADPVWTLTATNEWGTSTAIASLDMEDEPPFIVTFAADPNPFSPGDDVVLSHLLLNADSAFIDNGIGTVDPAGGSVTIQPTGTTTYTLSATNVNGTSTRELIVQLPNPVIHFLAASPNPFQIVGDDVVLSYGASFGATATITPDVGSVDPQSGAITVQPQQTTLYRLEVTNASGVATQDVVVQLLPPGIDLFEADPPVIFAGRSTTLRWQTGPGLDLSISPGVGTVPGPSGEVVVTPTSEETTYTLTASNAEGTTTVDVIVTWKVPEATLTTSSSTPFAGFPFTLAATIDGADSATLEPGLGSIDPGGGTFPVTVDSTTTFELAATNALGTTTSSVVIDPLPPEATLSVSDTSPPGGAAVTLTAVIQGALSATLEPGVGAIDPAGGTFEVTPLEKTTYILTAINPLATVTSEVTVTPGLPEASLTASNTTPFPQDSIDLVATIEGAVSATLEPGFGSIDPTGGTFTTTVPTETTFVLTAVGALGNVTEQVTVIPRAPEVTSLTTDLAQIVPGGSATLSWAVAGADLVQIEPGGFSSTDASGTFVVEPTTSTNYVLTASNTAGSTTAEILIEVLEFSIVSFTATPALVAGVADVTLEWEVEGNALVSIDGIGPQPQSGSTIVRPTMTTTYILRATGGGVTRTATATVVVNQPDAGDISFSWSGTEFPGTPPPLAPFVPFELWVVALNPPAGLEAYEFGVTALPAECWTFIGETIFPAGSSDFGVDTPNFKNYLVGTGATCYEGAIAPLVRLLLLTFDLSCFESGTVALGPASPSSFSPERPGYLACNSPGDLRPFGDSGFGFIDFGDVDGPPVTAVALALNATNEPEGVALDWELATSQAPDRVQVTRRDVDSGSERTLADWFGSEVRSRYLDQDAVAGVTYEYRVRMELGGDWISSEPVVWTRALETPVLSKILGNTPNPFNPRTEIQFVLAQAGAPVLEIFDSSGRRVRRVELGARTAGTHGWVWLGDDDTGRGVSSGVYYVRLTSQDGEGAHAMTLVR